MRDFWRTITGETREVGIEATPLDIAEADLDRALKYFSQAVTISNNTPRWLYVYSAGVYIPPGALNVTIPLPGVRRALLRWQAPEGYAQPAQVTGQRALAIFWRTFPLLAVAPMLTYPSGITIAGTVDVSDRAARVLGVADVSDRAGRLLGIVNSITNAVDISDRAGRLLGVIASITNAVDISDRAGRLLGVVNSITNAVDISDRAGRALGVVASITAAVDVGDRAVRLLGIVYGTVGQLTQKAASVLALATDTSLVVQLSPMDPQAATLGVTATGAVNTAVTATLPAAGAGLFHYITRIELVKLYSVIGVANGAGVIVTSTNLPGNPAWTTEQNASPAGTAVTVIKEETHKPIKSAAANTATTFVAPLQLQTIWRWNIRYYTAP